MNRGSKDCGEDLEEEVGTCEIWRLKFGILDDGGSFTGCRCKLFRTSNRLFLPLQGDIQETDAVSLRGAEVWL